MLRRSELEKMLQRKLKLVDILYNLEKFHTYYKKRTLRSRIGSGSTGQAEHHYGMGLVVVDTLPARARRSRAGSGADTGQTAHPCHRTADSQHAQQGQSTCRPGSWRLSALLSMLPFLQQQSSSVVRLES